jgi:Ca-activated chloride channel homolog
MLSRLSFIVLVTFLVSSPAFAQSGKAGPSGRRIETLNVIVRAAEGVQLTKTEFDLYDGGVQQEIESFARLDTGSRIILLVDSSTGLRAEATVVQDAVKALITELYEDDQMMVVGYNETAEIIEEMTPDLDKLQASPSKIIRKGFPNLFDALIAASDSLSSQAKTGVEKRAIVLISDGYDSGSKTKFEDLLNELQEENIVLFAIQIPDRTRGALLRDKPKPPAALEQLTVATGGAIYPIANPTEGAKAIADDLRRNWYRLVYYPSGINTISVRRLLLMPREKGIALRTKGSHPGRFK